MGTGAEQSWRPTGKGWNIWQPAKVPVCEQVPITAKSHNHFGQTIPARMFQKLKGPISIVSQTSFHHLSPNLRRRILFTEIHFKGAGVSSGWDDLSSAPANRPMDPEMQSNALCVTRLSKAGLTLQYLFFFSITHWPHMCDSRIVFHWNRCVIKVIKKKYTGPVSKNFGLPDHCNMASAR